VRDLICDVISYCAWHFSKGKISVYHKIVIENLKREKMEKHFLFLALHEFPSEIWFRSEIDRWTDARGNADIVYLIWLISQLCGSHTTIAVI